MVQFFKGSADPRDAAYGQLASALGQGLGKGLTTHFANKALDEVLNDQSMKDAPISAKMGKLQSAMMRYGDIGREVVQNRFQIEQQAEQEKQQGIQKKQSDIIGRMLNGKPVTDKERGMLSPEQNLAIAKHQQAIEIQNLKNQKPPKPTQASQPIDPDQLNRIQQVRANPEFEKAPPSKKTELLMDAGVSKENTDAVVKPFVDEAKIQAKSNIQERSFQTSYSKDAVKNANELRSSIPKKESALNYSRNAIETGNVGYFSPDKLADATGVDLFRTAKGAQLVTAGKENLLSNMSRVTAKAQNIWFEQRLNSMFPKIGQSPEANLTVQEMIEGEVAMDKAYLKEFDRLAKEDNETYGYERKDLEQRARDAVKPIEKHIMDRTTFRLKQLEEQEKGLNELKKEVGKKVVKGTPLTLAMAKLYTEKFGDEALKIAEENGYKIPSIEEFSSFQMNPQEHRENL